MFFGKKDKDRDSYEDPVARYGRMLRDKGGKKGRIREKPSLLARIFGSGHDSDFVYHDD
jgi:hypothetical protein